MRKIIYNGQEMTLLANDEYDYLLREIEHLRKQVDDLSNNRPVKPGTEVNIRRQLDQMCYIALLMQNSISDIAIRIPRDIELASDNSKRLYEQIKEISDELKKSLSEEEGNE